MEEEFKTKIYNIAERRSYTPNHTSTDYHKNFFNTNIPIVIDNGMYVLV